MEPQSRQDIRIISGQDSLAAWLYTNPRYSATKKGPAIILAHGLGAVKEMKLDQFAEEFRTQGYTAVAFDYRCHGGSTGKPRSLIDFAMQRADWNAAIKYTRELEMVDPDRVVLFGTSLSGGHVIQVAAGDTRIAAVISQCPFTSGFASGLTIGVKPLPKMAYLGIKDMLFSTQDSTTNVALAGQPGEAALMNAPDVINGYHQLLPPGFDLPYTVPARIGLKILLERPGAYASRVQCPILFAICGQDSVAPAKAALSFAKQAPKGVLKYYDHMSHFTIYRGMDHDKAFKDYFEFLHKHVPPKYEGERDEVPLSPRGFETQQKNRLSIMEQV